MCFQNHDAFNVSEFLWPSESVPAGPRSRLVCLRVEEGSFCSSVQGNGTLGIHLGQNYVTIVQAPEGVNQIYYSSKVHLRF